MSQPPCRRPAGDHDKFANRCNESRFIHFSDPFKVTRLVYLPNLDCDLPTLVLAHPDI